MFYNLSHAVIPQVCGIKVVACFGFHVVRASFEAAVDASQEAWVKTRVGLVHIPDLANQKMWHGNVPLTCPVCSTSFRQQRAC